MSEELERYKRALAGARHALGMIERNPQVLSDTCFLPTVQKELDDILNPPQEFEDVPLERWAVVAPSGFVELTVSSESLAEEEVSEDGRYPNYQLVKLTGTVKRPVKRPVVREVEFPCSIERHSGGIRASFNILVSGNNSEEHAALRDSLEGKTGTLIFRWTD